MTHLQDYITSFYNHTKLFYVQPQELQEKPPDFPPFLMHAPSYIDIFVQLAPKLHTYIAYPSSILATPSSNKQERREDD